MPSKSSLDPTNAGKALTKTNSKRNKHMLEKFNNQTRILTRKIQKQALNFKLKRHFLTSIPSIQTDSTEENHEQNKNKELKSLKRRESEISCGIGAGTSQPNHSAALLSH